VKPRFFLKADTSERFISTQGRGGFA